MWAGYQTRLVHLGWNAPAGNYSVGWGGGQVTFSFTALMDMPMMSRLEKGFVVSRMPIEPDGGQLFFPPAVFVTEDWPGIAFAIWLFMAIYLTAWLGGLVLLQRRKRRWLRDRDRLGGTHAPAVLQS